MEKEKDQLLGAEGRVLRTPLGHPVLPHPVGELPPCPGRTHRREKC